MKYEIYREMLSWLIQRYTLGQQKIKAVCRFCSSFADKYPLLHIDTVIFAKFLRQKSLELCLEKTSTNTFNKCSSPFLKTWVHAWETGWGHPRTSRQRGREWRCWWTASRVGQEGPKVRESCSVRRRWSFSGHFDLRRAFDRDGCPSWGATVLDAFRCGIFGALRHTQALLYTLQKLFKASRSLNVLSSAAYSCIFLGSSAYSSDDPMLDCIVSYNYIQLLFHQVPFSPSFIPSKLRRRRHVCCEKNICNHFVWDFSLSRDGERGKRCYLCSYWNCFQRSEQWKLDMAVAVRSLCFCLYG